MAKPDKPQSHLDAETLAQPSSAMTPTIEDSAMPARLPERIGQYHIKRVIAAGGMGVVYEAMQEHPRRSVALKIMRQGIASRSALRRFEYESQILARLRHPGIAQVYEAGMHDDGTGGVPYFAMEYIAGAKDLVDYARSKELSIRERLELFDKVCDALHHGHQKGIIHRDLKPANILVDSTGQPKIIDFGVARATDSDLAVPTLQTDVGQLVGTVQYMSPEQIAADPHDIDTRSDVYALGVVLYKMLTDQLPYDVSGTVIYEATRMVREQAPKRLSTINRVLRGDIETIVMHALEKDRERRYQSAIELAADIRRYLSNRPILARPPSVAYNFKTYVKRNKVVVTALVGIFAALVLGIITTSWQRGVAVQERDRAEHMFGQVRGLAKTFVFDFFDKIKFLDGSLEARELLVTSALKYLDSLAAEAPDNPDLMREVGAAYNRVGDIQGGFRNPSLGDTEGAIKSYRRAMEILQGLAASSPENHELLDDVAATHTRIGDVLINTNNVTGALDAYNQGLAIREKMPEDTRHGRLLSFSLNSVGGALLQLGRLTEAAARYDRSLQVSQKIAALEPNDIQLQRELSVAYGKVGDVLAETGEYQSALLRYQERARIRKQIQEKEPSGTANRDVAVAQLFIGQAHFELDQPQQALEHLKQFLDVAAQRDQDNPRDWRSRRDLVAAHEFVGLAYLKMNDLAAAREHLEQASALVAPLAETSEKNIQVRERVAACAEALGELAMKSGSPAEAAARYREALTIFQQMTTAEPENFKRRSDQARALQELGSALAAAGEGFEARLRLDEARQLFETLYREHPEYASIRKGLATTLVEVASTRRADGDAASAVALEADAAKLRGSGTGQRDRPPTEQARSRGG